MVPHRGGMPGLRPAAALAGGVRLPAMRSDWGGVGNGAWGVSLPGMCWRDVADGRHDLRGDAQAIADVVPADVVRHQPEERRQCLRLAAGCLGWVATRQPGRGSTNCAGRWFDPAGIASRAPSRSTKPMSAARKWASEDGKSRPRPSLWWRPRRAAAASAASAFGAWPPVPPPRPADGGHRTGPLPLHHHTQDIRQSPRIRGMKGIPTWYLYAKRPDHAETGTARARGGYVWGVRSARAHRLVMPIRAAASDVSEPAGMTAQGRRDLRATP